MQLNEMVSYFLGEGVVGGTAREIGNIPSEIATDLASITEGFEKSIERAHAALEEAEDLIRVNKDVAGDPDHYFTSLRGKISAWRYVNLLDSSLVSRLLEGAKTGKKDAIFLNTNVGNRKIEKFTTAKKISELQSVVQTAKTNLQKFEALANSGKFHPDTSPYWLGQVLSHAATDLRTVIRSYINFAK